MKVLNVPGVLSQSEMFFYRESEFARNALYYIVVAGEFYCNKDYNTQRDTFNCFLILLIHKGTMRIKYNNNQYLANENDIVLLNCYNPHLYAANGDVHFEYFHFDGNSAEKYFELLYNKIGCVFPINNNLVISKYIHEIVQMAKNDDKDDHFVSMFINNILYELVQITNPKEKVLENQIRQAISYIGINYYKEIIVEELSESVNLSVYHFSRIFKQYTGSSPYQYILDYRIHNAKKLLQNTDDSIETVAFASGFNSLSHFVTTFKKRINLTPNKFRKLKF